MPSFRPLALLAILALGAAVQSRAAEIAGVKVFDDRDYARVAFELDQPVQPVLEVVRAENLVFVRFAGTSLGPGSRTVLCEGNPHLESVTFLPLGETTVARIKARHPFKLRTFEIANPPRFVLEVAGEAPEGLQPPVAPVVQPVAPVVQTKAEAHPASTPPTAADGYYGRGLEQMRQGNHQAALISFRSAIRARQRVEESYYQAGVVRYRLGEDELARVNFSRAADSRSFGAAARLWLAWLDHRAGDRPRLAADWNSLVLLSPSSRRRELLAAGIAEIDYRALEQAAQAAQAAQDQPVPAPAPETASPAAAVPTASAAAPEDSVAELLHRGRLAQSQGRLEEAAAALEQVVALDSGHSEACFQLGVIYQELGQAGKSARYFERSLGQPMEEGRLSAALPLAAEPVEESLSGTASASTAPELVETLLPDSLPAGETDSVEAGEDTLAAAALAATVATPGDGNPLPEQSALLARLRRSAARLVNLPDPALVRRQVAVMTGVLGLLFVLALLGGRLLPAGKRGSAVRLAFAGNVVPAAGSAGGPRPEQPAIARPREVTIIEKKQQMERMLARELASKREARVMEDGAVVPAASVRVAPASGGEGLELRLGRPQGGGVYGADIARRIKEQLQKNEVRGAGSQGGLHARRAGDEPQVRLIRQLRAKQWTVSDIAQELGLSREEIKWALGGREEGAAPEDHPLAAEQAQANGQARRLLESRRPPHTPPVTSRIDREVDFELEINV